MANPKQQKNSQDRARAKAKRTSPTRSAVGFLGTPPKAKRQTTKNHGTNKRGGGQSG